MDDWMNGCVHQGHIAYHDVFHAVVVIVVVLSISRPIALTGIVRFHILHIVRMKALGVRRVVCDATSVC
jgi:hypothetical protein